MLVKCAHVAELAGIKDSGFRVVINDGKHGCAVIDHLHIHLIGGEKLSSTLGTNL